MHMIHHHSEWEDPPGIKTVQKLAVGYNVDSPFIVWVLFAGVMIIKMMGPKKQILHGDGRGSE